MKIGRTCTKIW